MKQAKNSLSRKPKPKQNPSQNQSPLQNRNMEERVRLLEGEVDRLSHINQLYRQQLQQLEGDNLALISQLQGMKVGKQVVMDTRIAELDIAVLRNQELIRIVHLLEGQLANKDLQLKEGQKAYQSLEEKIRKMEDALIDRETLKTQVERYKIKLLESEKYWLTRTETLLASKEAEKEKRFLESETTYQQKIRLLSEELALKDRVIDEKTEEIHKLIHYIQSKLQ